MIDQFAANRTIVKMMTQDQARKYAKRAARSIKPTSPAAAGDAKRAAGCVEALSYGDVHRHATWAAIWAAAAADANVWAETQDADAAYAAAVDFMEEMAEYGARLLGY